MALTLSSSRLRRLLASALVASACILGTSAWAVDCKVAGPRVLSEAEKAFSHGNYDQAAQLYQQDLQKNPGAPDLTAGLALVLLRQQKVDEADQLVQQALARNSKSAVLLTTLGQVQYRQGEPWLAVKTVNEALKIDPCYPALHLLEARLLQINSHYLSASDELQTAHLLDPYDPQIRMEWVGTLSLPERIKELESYLAGGGGDDPDEVKYLNFELAFLKRELTDPHKSCTLVSTSVTSTMPFAELMDGPRRLRAFGLDVKINDRKAQLEVDTGASGLLISRSVAERAGLQVFTRTVVGGIGSHGDQAAYTAFADDIKIGSLEFRDCQVEVLDKRDILDSDGLIGMNVFSRFLVTLDYPMRRLMLGPLPPRPGDAESSRPTLETAGGHDQDDAAANAAGAKPGSPATTSHGPYDRYIAPEMKDWTPVYRIGHDLLIPTSLNGGKQKIFVVDTGAFGTTISSDVAREVSKLHSTDNITIKGLSGKVAQVYTAGTIDFVFSNVEQKVKDVIAFDNPSLDKNMGMKISGFIGFTTLGQLTVSIDYRDGLMKFVYDPNRRYVTAPVL